MKAFAFAAILCLVSVPVAAQAPTIRGDPNKEMTNCPPSKPQDAQAVDKSAILPDAEGEEKSAAPTTQRQGETVVASPKCAEETPQKPK